MGERISAGMESDYHVANVVANHFVDLDKMYVDYKNDTIQLRTYMERQWNFVAGMADTFLEMKL